MESNSKEKLDELTFSVEKARGQGHGFTVKFNYDAGEFQSATATPLPSDPALVALLKANVDSGLTQKTLVEMASLERIGERDVRKFIKDHMNRIPGIRGKGNGAHRKLFWQEAPGQQDFNYRLEVEGDEQQ